MKKNQFIPSVNFHLWEPCNMQCKYCFATFQDVRKSVLPKGHLPKEKATEVIKLLAKHGFKKITFAGGEPTLCPWLLDLLKVAKFNGMTTMIVTNGILITREFIHIHKPFLDWIALSVDSLSSNKNAFIGRKYKGNNTLSELDYLHICKMVLNQNIRLKINTVVSQINKDDDFNSFIMKALPDRWKVLQVMPIIGQNDKFINSFLINDNEYNNFLTRHKVQASIIPENNNQLKNTYVMVDPAGRFFSNDKGFHQYSKSIVEVGVEQAIKEMNYDYVGFISRQGLYKW